MSPAPEPAPPAPAAGWDAGQTLGGFARACRAAGLPVTADRERTFLTACAATGLGERPAQ